MKRKALNLSIFLLVSFGVQIFIFELWDTLFNKEKPNVFEIADGEQFDPALSRLKSISTFAAYCDSTYGNTWINASDSERYATIISQTLRERFYHGYSYYRLDQNSLAFFFSPLL